jgi:uncharacterized membrane protein YfhO
MFVVFSFHLNHNIFFVIINITIIMKISFSYRYLIFFVCYFLASIAWQAVMATR